MIEPVGSPAPKKEEKKTPAPSPPSSDHEGQVGLTKAKSDNSAITPKADKKEDKKPKSDSFTSKTSFTGTPSPSAPRDHEGQVGKTKAVSDNSAITPKAPKDHEGQVGKTKAVSDNSAITPKAPKDHEGQVGKAKAVSDNSAITPKAPKDHEGQVGKTKAISDNSLLTQSADQSGSGTPAPSVPVAKKREVKPGDTLTEVVQDLKDKGAFKGMTDTEAVAKLAKDSKIDDPDVIKPNQILNYKVPAPDPAPTPSTQPVSKDHEGQVGLTKQVSDNSLLTLAPPVSSDREGRVGLTKAKSDNSGLTPAPSTPPKDREGQVGLAKAKSDNSVLTPPAGDTPASAAEKRSIQLLRQGERDSQTPTITGENPTKVFEAARELYNGKDPGLNEHNIRYSNGGNIDADAVEYGTNQFKPHDDMGDADGRLSREEAAGAYVDPAEAERAFTTGDLNKDGFIDGKEQGAYNLFVDSSTDKNEKNPFADGLVTIRERNSAANMLNGSEADRKRAQERMRHYYNELLSKAPT